MVQEEPEVRIDQTDSFREMKHLLTSATLTRISRSAERYRKYLFLRFTEQIHNSDLLVHIDLHVVVCSGNTGIRSCRRNGGLIRQTFACGDQIWTKNFWSNVVPQASKVVKSTLTHKSFLYS